MRHSSISKRLFRGTFAKLVSVFALVMMMSAPAFAALKSVGPVDTNNGFPVSYTDANNVTLKQCLDLVNCTLLPADLPNPAVPLSFPGNWPEEIFWWTGDAVIQVAGPVPGVPVDAALIMALEGAFFNGPVLPNDQVTFSRIRLKINGLSPNAAYTITHPYGVLDLTADADGTILFVNDCGMGLGGDPAGFSFLLNCPIGPFLTWDTAQSVINPDTGLPVFDPPAGFVGDAAIAHPVKGSPFETNVFRIEAKTGPLFMAETIDFVVTGQTSAAPAASSTILNRATYSRPAGVGVPQAQIFADATTASNLVVSSVGGAGSPIAGPIFMEQIITPANPLAVPPTPAVPTGKFFANVDLSANIAGALPRNIIVTDLTLNPPDSALSATLRDRVNITSATYNQATGDLVVTATSSDEISNPTLSVLGNSGGLLVAGNFTANLPGPPDTVTVQSSLGGISKAGVVLAGPGSGAVAPFFTSPIANAGADQVVFFDTRVDLSAAASTGVIAEYSWSQLTGPPVLISNASTSDISFNFPSPVAPATTVPAITLQVNVVGPGGTSIDTVVIDSITVPPVIGTVVKASAKLDPNKGDEWRIDGTALPVVAGSTIAALIVTDSAGNTVDLIAAALAAGANPAKSGPPAIDAIGAWQWSSKGFLLTSTLASGQWTVHTISSTGHAGPTFVVTVQ